MSKVTPFNATNFLLLQAPKATDWLMVDESFVPFFEASFQVLGTFWDSLSRDCATAASNVRLLENIMNTCIALHAQPLAVSGAFPQRANVFAGMG